MIRKFPAVVRIGIEGVPTVNESKMGPIDMLERLVAELADDESYALPQFSH